MRFEKLAIMKKSFPSFKDGKRNYIYDASLIDSIVDWHGGLNIDGKMPNGVFKSILFGNIERQLKLYPGIVDLFGVDFTDYHKHYYFEFQASKTYVYDAKTGKQLYCFIKIIACRVVIYTSIYYNALPTFSNNFGKWTSCIAETSQVEITA